MYSHADVQCINKKMRNVHKDKWVGLLYTACSCPICTYPSLNHKKNILLLHNKWLKLLYVQKTSGQLVQPWPFTCKWLVSSSLRRISWTRSSLSCEISTIRSPVEGWERGGGMKGTGRNGARRNISKPSCEEMTTWTLKKEAKKIHKLTHREEKLQKSKIKRTITI